MKGVVFTEFLEMVEAKWSLEMVDQLIERAKPPSGGVYTAVGTYAPAEMVALVSALSEATDMPIPDLLKAFGGHLFGTFARNYPQFLEGRDTSFAFLESVESVIHVEVRKLYPDAELPSHMACGSADQRPHQPSGPLLMHLRVLFFRQ